MQFTIIFAIAAAVVGVSANVHPACKCVDINNNLDKTTTDNACTFYPRLQLFNKDESPVLDPASVILDIDPVTNNCVSKDAATGLVSPHLGGNQFQDACVRNAPDNVVSNSVCEK